MEPIEETMLSEIVTRDRDVNTFWFTPAGYTDAAERVIAMAMRDRRALLAEVRRLRAFEAARIVAQSCQACGMVHGVEGCTV